MTPETREYRLFRLLHGDMSVPSLTAGEIPFSVARKLGWATRKVTVTIKDAQKIVHHPMHAMDAIKGLQLPMVITHGDYYRNPQRGTPLQIEVVLHEPSNPKRAYFLALSRNQEDTGIFIRTFYYNAKLSRRRLAGAEKLLIQSVHNYFK